MEFEKALINEVRNHSCLFDLASPQYKNVVEKDAVWEDIGRRLNSDGDTCRKKWKVLRGTYRRIKQAEFLKSGSPAPSRRRKKWRHLAAMSFLGKAQTSRCTIGKQQEEHGDCSQPCEVPYVGDRPASEASITPTSSSASLPEYRQIQDDFGAIMAQISSSANQIAQSFEQVEKTRVSIAFSGMAKIIIGANMPESLERSVIHKAQTVVFRAVQEWNERNIKDDKVLSRNWC